jgi:hypothetical protein
MNKVHNFLDAVIREKAIERSSRSAHLTAMALLGQLEKAFA